MTDVLTEKEKAQLMQAHDCSQTCLGADGYCLVPIVVAEAVKGHVIAALRDAAAALYNGAGDPEQRFYDDGVSPWLERRATRIELGVAP